MTHSQSAWLVAYDITDPKRLCRVHRLLLSYAVAVQYSVFAGAFSPAQLQAVLRELRARINDKQDDVRLYPLPVRCEPVLIGAAALPDGVSFGPAGLGIFRLLHGPAPAALTKLRDSLKSAAVDPAIPLPIVR